MWDKDILQCAFICVPQMVHIVFSGHQILSGIELRIAVYNQDILLVEVCKCVRDVYCQRRLADAALHVHKGNDLHVFANLSSGQEKCSPRTTKDCNPKKHILLLRKTG